MPKNKVYERMEYDGEEHLLLLDDQSLKELDISWCKTREDVQAMNRLLHEFISTVEKFFWIDTGVSIKLVAHKDGFHWLAPDNRDISMRYVHLSQKARKFKDKIVARVNEYAEVLSENPDKIEEVMEEYAEDESRERSSDS